MAREAIYAMGYQHPIAYIDVPDLDDDMIYDAQFINRQYAIREIGKLKWLHLIHI